MLNGNALLFSLIIPDLLVKKGESRLPWKNDNNRIYFRNTFELL